MNVPETIHPENSPDNSNRAADGGNSNRADARAEVHDRIGLLLGIIALVVASCTATYVITRLDQLEDRVIQAEDEAKVVNDNYNEIKGALNGK